MFRLFVIVSLLSFIGCRAQIHHGLEEREANELVSVLVGRGFDAKKVPEKGKKPTWAVEVPDDKATDALRVLTELKLPRAPRTTTRDVAAQGSLVETPGAERLKQLEAQEGDIEQSLETMDGVVSASVELVVPAPPRPGQQAVPSKASVLIRAQAGASERLLAQKGELKGLVAAAVDGLVAEEVVLLVDTVQPLVSAQETTSAQGSLRGLVIALGAGVSLLAVLLIGLTFLYQRERRKLRAAQAHVTQPLPAAPTAPRPTVNPSVQRKVA
jgi:type III secretion protein J